jgi:two-component system chemotaxis response regulator CheY
MSGRKGFPSIPALGGVPMVCPGAGRCSRALTPDMPVWAEYAVAEGQIIGSPGRAAMKVLALDDDRHYLRMVKMALEDEGHDVLVATSGAAGLALIPEAPPDVILLDVRMPGIDGRSFARAYASLPGPHAPIIVVTGTDDVAARKVKNAAGYLAKPFELDALLRMISEVGPSG